MSRFHQHKEIQKRVFEEQLDLALRIRKPIVIHCRDAEKDCLEIMGKVFSVALFLTKTAGYTVINISPFTSFEASTACGHKIHPKYMIDSSFMHKLCLKLYDVLVLLWPVQYSWYW